MILGLLKERGIMEKVLEMKNITKRFPGVLALDSVELDLHKGEILALLGENGAGKSTLMKILSGAIQYDTGEILLEGKPLVGNTPGDIINQGIAVMYQEINCLEELSIAENIFNGNLPVNRIGNVNYKKLRVDTAKLLLEVGLEKDPLTIVNTLSTAEKQMMEIAKVLSKENKVLVMDEPTSALNDVEVGQLFELITKLADEGKSIIYISHKLDELFAISNRIEVLRDGRYIGTVKTQETTPHQLVSMMVGRDIDDMFPKEDIELGDVVLDVDRLSGSHIIDISFNVRSGEILGMFGLMGAGRTEIVETIFGKRKKTGGSIRLMGKEIKIKNPRAAIKNKIVYVPRERKSEGLCMEGSVKENLTLTYLEELSWLMGLNIKKKRFLVNNWIKKMNIKTSSMDTPISALSGGNQQKVVIAKWLITEPEVLILNEPTRGVDVGAKVEIYKLIEELCKSGLAIIMISSETPEIMGIADRIVTVHEGRVTGELEREAFDQEKLMFMAIGG